MAPTQPDNELLAAVKNVSFSDVEELFKDKPVDDQPTQEGVDEALLYIAQHALSPDKVNQHQYGEALKIKEYYTERKQHLTKSNHTRQRTSEKYSRRG